jgi:hypothetical protein
MCQPYSSPEAVLAGFHTGHGYRLLARTVLEQWNALVRATVATRRHRPPTLMPAVDGRPRFGGVVRPTAPEAPSQ